MAPRNLLARLEADLAALGNEVGDPEDRPGAATEPAFPATARRPTPTFVQPWEAWMRTDSSTVCNSITKL